MSAVAVSVPDDAYLTNEIRLVQVLGRDREGRLVCEDVLAPVEDPSRPLIVDAHRVRSSRSRHDRGRWRIVVPMTDEELAASEPQLVAA